MKKGLLVVALANFAAAGAAALTLAWNEPVRAESSPALAAAPVSAQAAEPAPTPAAKPAALTAEQAATLRETAQARTGSVVTVDAYADKNGEPDHRQAAGVVISSSGFIFAPLFAVNGAEILIINYGSGARSPARIIARDTRSHLAILKANVVPANITFPGFCGTGDEKGDTAVVMVAPDRTGRRTLAGTVAGTRESVGPLRNVLAVSMEGAPGVNGGVLFNARGEMVGLALAAEVDEQNAAADRRTTVFILPASEIRAAMERILQGAPGSNGEKEPRVSVA